MLEASYDYGLIAVVVGLILTVGWTVTQSLIGLGQAALYVGGIVLAAVALSRIQNRAPTETSQHAPEEDTGEFGELRLLTPVNIDTRAVETGLLACDCGMVMGGIPMLAPTKEGDDAEVETLPRPRSQSTTWGGEAMTSERYPGDIEEYLKRPNEYQTMLCYFREFLAKPHPAVGRPGPVCPFVPMSLKRDIIYLTMVHTQALQESATPAELRQALVRLLVSFIPRFEGLHPSTGKLRQYKAAVLVFPDVAVREAHEVIDLAQEEAKPQFVAKGLMCGEFHAANNATGLRNPNFYPLRTPYPCLAIRHMVPGDFVFMTLDNYEKGLQLQLLRNFMDVFGKQRDLKEVKDAKERLAKLEEEMATATLEPSHGKAKVQ